MPFENDLDRMKAGVYGFNMNHMIDSGRKQYFMSFGVSTLGERIPQFTPLLWKRVGVRGNKDSLS